MMFVNVYMDITLNISTPNLYHVFANYSYKYGTPNKIKKDIS